MNNNKSFTRIQNNAFKNCNNECYGLSYVIIDGFESFFMLVAFERRLSRVFFFQHPIANQCIQSRQKNGRLLEQITIAFF